MPPMEFAGGIASFLRYSSCPGPKTERAAVSFPSPHPLEGKKLLSSAETVNK